MFQTLPRNPYSNVDINKIDSENESKNDTTANTHEDNINHVDQNSNKY